MGTPLEVKITNDRLIFENNQRKTPAVIGPEFLEIHFQQMLSRAIQLQQWPPWLQVTSFGEEIRETAKRNARINHVREWENRAPKPGFEGVVDGMPNEVYHRIHDAVSNSGVSRLMLSVGHYYEGMRPGAGKPSADMVIGSALHDAILLPGEFEDGYQVVDMPGRLSKAFAEVQDEAAGNYQTAILRSEYELVLRMRDRLMANPLVRRIFSGGRPEQSVFWVDQETGLWCRARLDYVAANGWGIDLKTCTHPNAHPNYLGHHMGRSGWHRQAAFYMAGWNAIHPDEPIEEFRFVVIEKQDPLNFSVPKIPEEQIRIGWLQCQAYMNKLVAHQAHPKPETKGYPLDITVDIPRYHLEVSNV